MSTPRCIQNVGEYYSAHYLDTTLQNNLAAIRRQWNERGSRSPANRFQALAVPSFRAKTDALELRSPADRWKPRSQYPDLDGWHAAILHALGYTLTAPQSRWTAAGTHTGARRHRTVRRTVARYRRNPVCRPESSLSHAGRAAGDGPLTDQLVEPTANH